MEQKQTVSQTVNNDLCISCGICAAVCPKGCISYERAKGLYLPKIGESCIRCGLCASVCPGLHADYQALYGGREMPDDLYFGNCLICENAMSRDRHTREQGVSGGVITAVIRRCLQAGDYSAAFVVKENLFHAQVRTEAVTAGEDLTATQGSRYLPVSMEVAVKRMLENPEEKLILVGTSCCIQGILNAVRQFGLRRENYLLLGLFCDRNLNYDAFRYFADNFAGKKPLAAFHYRYKGKKGWPGDLHMTFRDGNGKDIDRWERIRVKELFTPERCLYCLDKLNQFADISFGDNYTDRKLSSPGSSTVIVRTEEGLRIWNAMKAAGDLETGEVTPEEAAKSQFLDKRRNNASFARIKEERCGIAVNNPAMADTVTEKQREAYAGQMALLNQGKDYEANKTKMTVKRILSKLKRTVLKK